MTLTRMMEIATWYANREEEDRLRSGKSKPAGCWGGGGGGGPAGGGGRRPSPLAILVSQWHFRVVWFDGLAPLWNLQGPSRVCS